MNNNTVGDRLRALRKNKNLTQDDLANLLGVSRVQVNQWECGARDVSNERIIKLADIFNTSCDYLMRGIEPEIKTVNVVNEVSKESSELDALLSSEVKSALCDLNNLEPESKASYTNLFNKIIGSRSFWNDLMPNAVLAYSLKDVKQNLNHSIVSINEASEFLISAATKAFRSILSSTIKSNQIDSEIEYWTEKYKKESSNIETPDRNTILKLFGINL